MYINRDALNNWQPSHALVTWISSSASPILSVILRSLPIVEWLPNDWKDNIGTKNEHEQGGIETYGL